MRALSVARPPSLLRALSLSLLRSLALSFSLSGSRWSQPPKEVSLWNRGATHPSTSRALPPLLSGLGASLLQHFPNNLNLFKNVRLKSAQAKARIGPPLSPVCRVRWTTARSNAEHTRRGNAPLNGAVSALLSGPGAALPQRFPRASRSILSLSLSHTLSLSLSLSSSLPLPSSLLRQANKL